jgi:hypothetical protein
VGVKSSAPGKLQHGGVRAQTFSMRGGVRFEAHALRRWFGLAPHAKRFAPSRH